MLIVLGLLALPAVLTALEHEVRYPDDAGVIDIRRDYGAIGDGVADDTAAIQRAVSENMRRMRIIYFPNGTYRLTTTVEFGRSAGNLTLQGQSERGVVLRLDDAIADFGTAQRPAPVISMYPGAPDNRVYGNGFSLYLRNLTIDIGRGNPHAAGVRFLSNNTGGMRQVTIRSADPAGLGAAGIICDVRAAGPALLRHVTIEGFDHGLHTTVRGYNLVFEFLTLRRQRVAGITTNEPVVIRGLHSENSVPVVVVPMGERNQHRFAQVTILDGVFLGGSPEQPAIRNGGFVTLRNVRAEGYARLVENRHNDTPHWETLQADDYVSDVAHSLFPSALRSLRLPVEETPEPPHDPIENWVRVQSTQVRREYWDRPKIHFVFVADGDRALQAAIDRAASEGRHTVYVPNLSKTGEVTKYYINQPVRIHGSVRRIIGLGNDLEITGPLREQGLNAFVLSRDLTSDTVWIEDFAFRPIAEGRVYDFTTIMHESDATLVLRDIAMPTGFAYRSRGRGKVFLECVVGSDWFFEPGQRVWARQFNTEGFEDQTVVRQGDLWVLGLKTEQEGMVLRAENARVEIIGGYLTPSHAVRLPGIPDDRPAFHLVDSQASIAIQFDGATDRKTQYLNLVREVRAGEQRDLPLAALPLWGRHGGGTIQRFSSITPDAKRADDGHLLREFWHAQRSPASIAGWTLPKGEPDGRTFPVATVMPMVHPGFEPKAQLGQGYVERYRFHLLPPTSGSYRFHLAGQNRRDVALLRVATEDDPSDLSNVAWDQPIDLQAGRPVAVEVLSQRFDAYNVIRIGWHLPDGKQELPIPAARLLGAPLP